MTYATNEKGTVVAIECQECNGKGQVSIFDCSMPSSACCGGCYKDYQCYICNGDGEIDIDHTDENIVDRCMMIKSIDYRITGFNDLLTWYRNEPGADLLDLKQQIANLKDRKYKILNELWGYIYHSKQVDIDWDELNNN